MNLQAKKISKVQTQMRRGVLELCILAIISEQEAYPTDIICRLRDECRLEVVEGTIYPLLTRLKNEGFLEYDWRESSQGPPRKYYKVTDEGNDLLSGLLFSWEKLVECVELSTQNIKSNE